MAITIKDIAAACGVSRGTVDRALNNRGGINSETKNHIIDTAKKLGYQPNLLAKSLVTGKSYTIGLLVFDLHNEFFAEFVHCAQKYCLDKGYHLITMVSNMDKDIEKKCVDNLVSRNIDGLIISSVHKDKKYIAYLKALQIPVVSITNRLDTHIPYIGIDDYNAMYDATNLALHKTYRNFIYISPPLRFKSSHNVCAPLKRYEGFLGALSNANTDGKKCKKTLIKSENYIEELIENYIRKDVEVKKPKKSTCIICSSDIFAVHILSSLREKNMHLPSHYGIMGFDQLSIQKLICPTMTTVAYPIEEVASQSVHTLFSIIHQEELSLPVTNILLPYRLIKGKSI